MKKKLLVIISIFLIGFTLIGCDDTNTHNLLSNWTKAEITDARQLFDITYGNNVYVAVGIHALQNEDGSYNTLIMTKTDATYDTPWQKTILPRTIETPLGTIGIGHPYAINYLNNQFIAVGQYGTIITSSDPTSDDIGWMTQTRSTNNNLYGITYGNNLYVAVGDNGTIVTSTGGTTWTSQTSGTSNDLYGITYGNNQFIVVGGDRETAGSSTIVTSPDGTTWTQQTSNTNRNINGITYGNNLFVAVGSHGTILTNSNPTSNNERWTTQTSNAKGNELNNITYINNQFIAAGTDTITTSTNGTTWTAQTSGPNSLLRLQGVTYGNNQYIVVGFQYVNNKITGIILTSK